MSLGISKVLKSLPSHFIKFPVPNNILSELIAKIEYKCAILESG